MDKLLDESAEQVVRGTDYHPNDLYKRVQALELEVASLRALRQLDAKERQAIREIVDVWEPPHRGPCDNVVGCTDDCPRAHLVAAVDWLSDQAAQWQHEAGETSEQAVKAVAEFIDGLRKGDDVGKD